MPLHSHAATPPITATPTTIVTPTLPRTTPQTTPPPTEPRLLPDVLGKLVAQAWQQLQSSTTWEQFINLCRPFSDLTAKVGQLPHRAAKLLEYYRRHGVPVHVTTAPWDRARKEATLHRGAHASALDHVQFLRQEFATMMQRGQWTVLPATAVMSEAALRLSPVGVVPQRERRPRTIVDYSFWGVNAETAPLAPKEAMQFGRAFLRILQALATANPAHGPVYLSKTDIADGFYRLALHARGLLRLGVVLPVSPGEDPLVALPLTLPMGWVNSPPCFTALTETVADITNFATHRNIHFGPHRLEQVAATEPSSTATHQTRLPHASAATTESRRPRRGAPLARTDLYVDDFVQLAQGSQARLRQLHRQLLHCLDSVLRPVEPSDQGRRQDPASVKKFLKGDGAWSTKKVLLGWLIDTVAGTVSLPPHRRERLQQLLADFPRHRKRAAVQAWHQLLGELRSMALGMPGARGLFSTLQEGLQGLPHRVRLTGAIHDTLDDFRYLANNLDARPARYFELVPQPPAVIGASDASGEGMGGVFFLRTRKGPPQAFLWRHRFPATVSDNLVSFDNPKGTINNSQLELAGVLAHRDAIATVTDVTEIGIATGSDNTAAVAWANKGSATTSSPTAYLLRTGALHQRDLHYCHETFYIPGGANQMADDSPALATVPTSRRPAFQSDLQLVQSQIRAGVVGSRDVAARGHWRQWLEFCADNNLDPHLRTFPDPVPILQVFAARYRDGRASPSGQPVRSRTVEDAIRSVGQALARLGAPDPRKDAQGGIDFRIQRQLKSFTRADDPPTRVKPIPLQVLQHVIPQLLPNAIPGQAATGNLIIVAFFYLLRPGEYTGTTSDNAAFRLADLQLFVGRRRIHGEAFWDTPEATLRAATGAALTFTTQKNGVRGEVVHHGCSGSTTLCPVQALVRQVLHLRAHTRSLQTPIATYQGPRGIRPVTAAAITAALRSGAAALGPDLGFLPADISARSLRAGGAMALLCADVDSDIIKLLGRWRSDEMMRYLHLQAAPIMRGFASRMLDASSYQLIPGQTVPIQ